MRLVTRGLLWLVSGLMLFLAARWLFDFQNISAEFGFPAPEPMGINTLRSDVTGVIFCIGLFIILYLVRGRQWLMPSILLVGSLTAFRLYSIAVDGFVDLAVPAIIAELVTLALLGVQAFHFDKPEQENRQ